MSQRTAIVVCHDCAGTGLGEYQEEGGYHAQCGWCLGQGHVTVDRTASGDLPDQAREWKSAKLGPVPVNPYRLTYP